MKVLTIASSVIRANSQVKKVQQARKFALGLDVNKGAAITSALKGFYSSAGEKLNDILIERKKLRYPTDAVEHNISVYENLPTWLQQTLKPSDVNRAGHIDQKYFKGLWEAGQDAKKTGVSGRCPVFRGAEDEALTANADMALGNDLFMDALDSSSPEVLAKLDTVSENIDLIPEVDGADIAHEILDATDIPDVTDVTDPTVVAKVKEFVMDVVDIVKDAL